MSYSKRIYDKAISTLKDRKQNAILKCEKTRNQIFSEIPQAQEIERQLSRSGIRAAKAVLAGADKKAALIKLKEDNLILQRKLSYLLNEHGYSVDDLEVNYCCSKCNDTGYIDGSMCVCMKTLLKEIALKELNSLSSLQNASFDSFKLSYYSNTMNKEGKIPRVRLSKIKSFCYDYAADFQKASKSILMSGGTGLGKTHLSLSIAQVVTAKGYGVVYCSAPDILRKLEEEHFSKNYIADTKDALIECDLLIIDDLGTEFATSFTKTIVYNIINARMLRSKPVIVNTNLSPEELKNLYSDRFVSRLFGDNLYIEFIGEDIRMKKKAQNKV